jgi:hypothetical protein
MMSQYDIDKAYISPYDRFLFEWDLTHEETPSQLKEIQKNQRIAKLRDEAQIMVDGELIWKAF